MKGIFFEYRITYQVIAPEKSAANELKAVQQFLSRYGRNVKTARAKAILLFRDICTALRRNNYFESTKFEPSAFWLQVKLITYNALPPEYRSIVEKETPFSFDFFIPQPVFDYANLVFEDLSEIEIRDIEKQAKKQQKFWNWELFKVIEELLVYKTSVQPGRIARQAKQEAAKIGLEGLEPFAKC